MRECSKQEYMKNFQIIVLVIFIVAAVIGVLVFSGAIPLGTDKNENLGTVVVWGTIPTQLIASPLKDFNDTNKNVNVTYIQKSADTFDQDLLEALASGIGPDLFFLPSDLEYHYANKIFTIPYTNYPLDTFKGVFAGAGEVFLTSKGIIAFPLYIDPLVMYYNRNMFDAGNIVYPPATWSDLINMIPSLTAKDPTNKIIKSAVAMGHYSNVDHAKDILTTLFMQAGNPILREENGIVKPTLDSNIGNYNLPSILQFYTSFADPNNAVYSWNKSFPDSMDVFSREDLAIYFGYGSELASLINKNPNQNFFIAPMPQIKGSNFKLTGAKVTGVAISSGTKNMNGAFTVASLMANSDFAYKVATALNVAPARRDLLALKPTDAYAPTLYSSALYAKGFADPSPKDTDNIWRGMIEAVLSNAMSPMDAVKDANTKLNLLLIR